MSTENATADTTIIIDIQHGKALPIKIKRSITMRYGVIDIGTNTIRGVVYEKRENGYVKREDKLVRSHLLRETRDGHLSEDGINRLVVVLNKLTHVFRESGCTKIGCFATSALREVSNRELVCEIVRNATGLDVEILSGAEEAECDFYALRACVPERNAVGLDLGGGSCQIIQFEHNRLLKSESYNIGSNRLKQKLVSGNIPTPEERKRIEFAVRNEMIGMGNVFGVRYLYAMGGTAKGALKLYSALTNVDCSDKFLSVEMLERLCLFGDRDPEKMYDVYSQIVKSRADTVIPGVIILKTICDMLSAAGVYIMSCGVRDGYLAKKRW